MSNFESHFDVYIFILIYKTMIDNLFQVPKAENEPVYSYAPGTKERKALKEALAEAKSKQIEIPMIIDGKEVKSGNLVEMNPPHDIKHSLGRYHKGDANHVQILITLHNVLTVQRLTPYEVCHQSRLEIRYHH